MERMYQALLWMSGAEIAIHVLIITISVASPARGNLDYGYSSAYGALTILLLSVMGSVAQYFGGGVALVGVALAWADRRQGWLIALSVLTVAAILFPFGFSYLATRIGGPWFAVGLFTAHSSLGSFLPALLALVFAMRGPVTSSLAR
jgi:hypothetical protein